MPTEDDARRAAETLGKLGLGLPAMTPKAHAELADIRSKLMALRDEQAAASDADRVTVTAVDGSATAPSFGVGAPAQLFESTSPLPDDAAVARIRNRRRSPLDQASIDNLAGARAAAPPTDASSDHPHFDLPPKLAVCVSCLAQYSPRAVPVEARAQRGVILCPGCNDHGVVWIDAVTDPHGRVMKAGRWQAARGTVILDLLVHCGKLSVALPVDGVPFCAVAWSSKRNHQAGDVPTIDVAAETRAMAAGASVNEALSKIAANVAAAARLGASVSFLAHTHSTKTTVADIVTSHPTGDARYVVQVCPNREAGGMFHTEVSDCARCGGAHASVAFWPFTRQDAVPVLCDERLTHFAFCPATGEPFLAGHDHFEEIGEQPMKPIDGPGTIAPASLHMAVAGIPETESAWRAGRNAGLDDRPLTDNPYPAGALADRWAEGHAKGRELARQ